MSSTHRSQAFEKRLARELSRAEIPARDLAAVLSRSPGYVSRVLSAEHDDFRLAVSDLPELAELLGTSRLVSVLDPLLEEMGLRVVPIEPADPVDVASGLLDLDVALGHVKEEYRAALDPSSPGGRSLTRFERARLVEHLRRSRTELDELLAGLETERGAA